MLFDKAGRSKIALTLNDVWPAAESLSGRCIDPLDPRAGLRQPLVSRTFKLEELAEAQKMFLEKSHTGKFVIRIKN